MAIFFSSNFDISLKNFFFTLQAGFNAGDQKNYYSIEGAQTDAVINLTLTSNVGIQGKWVFQVDDDIDDKKCNNVGKCIRYNCQSQEITLL